MKIEMRFLLLAVILPALLFASGCRTTVNFPSGGVFPSPYRINDAVVIAFPDDIKDDRFRVRVGSLWERHVFVLPVMDAYRSETVSRMNGLFTQGVTPTTHSVLKEIFEEHSDEVDDVARSDWDVLMGLGESSSAEANQESSQRRRGRNNEAMMRALREASIESVGQKNPTYLVIFQDTLLGFLDERATVSFRVQVLDTRTNNLLMEKRYRGRSQRFQPVRSNTTNQQHLVRLTNQAFSGAMSELIEDLARVTAARGMY